jgi:hypothetical protein
MATPTPNEISLVPNAPKQFECAVNTASETAPKCGAPTDNPFMTAHSEALQRLWDLSQRFAPSDR